MGRRQRQKLSDLLSAAELSRRAGAGGANNNGADNNGANNRGANNSGGDAAQRRAGAHAADVSVELSAGDEDGAVVQTALLNPVVPVRPPDHRTVDVEGDKAVRRSDGVGRCKLDPSLKAPGFRHLIPKRITVLSNRNPLVF